MSQIISANKFVMDLLTAQQRADGQISQNVYIAASYNSDTCELMHLWIGHRYCGPMLQFSGDGKNKYNGVVGSERDNCIDHSNYPDGCWTPIYSRGNFGKNYSHGGNWSGQIRGLHPRIGDQRTHDETTEIMLLPDNGGIIPLPDGIKGELSMTDIDCSVAWTIWYPSARRAMDARLSNQEIIQSTLPTNAKAHLAQHQTTDCIAIINEVINTFKL